MGYPGTPCHLKKGQMIDTQDGFVDTFNWMVDFINNLRGDGTSIEIDRSIESHPIINGSSGGGSIKGNTEESKETIGPVEVVDSLMSNVKVTTTEKGGTDDKSTMRIEVLYL